MSQIVPNYEEDNDGGDTASRLNKDSVSMPAAYYWGKRNEVLKIGEAHHDKHVAEQYGTRDA